MKNHVRTLIEQRRWPNSTVDISELRLVIDYQRQNGADRTLTLDIVDYPGEWLLDLPLLNKSYEQWSRESLALSREQPRAPLAAQWHAHLATLNAEGTRRRTGRADRGAAVHRLLARLPRRAFRHEPAAARPLPDAGQSRGFAGADLCAARSAGRRRSAGGIAVGDDARRYEAYKDVVVRPFFPRSFLAARSPGRAGRCAGGVQLPGRKRWSISRRRWREFWIVSGSAAARCFRNLFRPRIDRILFAATKADHLHHSSHDRLEAVLRRTVSQARSRAPKTPAPRSTSSRWPRCAPPARRRCSAAGKSCPRSWARLPPARSPMARRFDGETEVATFPGDLPADPEELVQGRRRVSRPLQRSGRKEPISAFCAFGRRCSSAKAPANLLCLTSALTAPSSS